MDKQKLNSETNLNEIKLDSGITKEETINDLFENVQNSNQNPEQKNKPLNQKETENKKRLDNQENKKSKSTIFTLPVIILMILVIVLILIIIYIIRKKMNKNDELIEDYETQKEKLLKENLELRKEIELTKQRVKLLTETNLELQDKIDENQYNIGQHKTKTFKEYKADKWKKSNKYIDENKKSSQLKEEMMIEETPTTLKPDLKPNENKHKKNEIKNEHNMGNQETNDVDTTEDIEENIENLLN